MLKFPNRAVDSKGDTIEFMLSENRDAKSAERFFEKALKSTHSVDPRVINVDKNAAYPPAMAALKEGGLVEKACKLRQVKYLNNIVEQDHRFIKRRVAPALGFASFHTAARTLRGYEAMNPNVAKVGGLQSQGDKGAAVVDLLQALGNAGSGVLRLSRRGKKMA